MAQLIIFKIESFEGKDVYLRCGNDEQDYLYCIAMVSSDGTADIVDNGYRSLAEAADAWPEAVR